MKSAWTVARRELRGFFDQATAYILIIAFVSLGLFLTFRSVYATGVATLRPLFDLLPWLFAVFIPAATMRSLAEERRTGTLGWLVAQPLDEGRLVLGKFLGNWLFVLITLAGTFPTAVGILAASEADPGIIAGQYVGAALLAAELVAIGLWASSMTRNQITAFILAVAVSLGLVLMGMPVVQIGLPPVLSGAVARLSVIGHFQNVARGVVDLRDVLYFVSVAALFLVMAVGRVSADRLSHGRPDFKRLRVGTLGVAAVVLVLNLLGGYIRGRIDLTRDRLYTLAPGTREILGELDDIVNLKLVASRELPPEIQLTLRDVRDLVADLRNASNGRLIVEEIDPDRDDDASAEASSLGIGPIEFNVLRDDEFQVRRGYFGLAVLYADEREVIPVIDRTDDLEFRLASAIASMTTERKPRVAFVGGFGARSAFQIPSLQRALADRYDVTTVALDGDSLPELSPDSTDLVVVAGPTEPVSPEALERIAGYSGAGGPLLVLLEKVRISQQFPAAEPVTTGLEPFLAERGVRAEDGVVFDLSSSERVSMGQRGIFQVIRPYPLWPILFRGAEHPTTRDLGNITVGWASPLVVTDSATVVPLWTTTEAGGVREPGLPIMPDVDFATSPEALAVETVAVAVDPGAGDAPVEGDGGGSRPGRMIVVSDANFLEEQFVQGNPQNLLFTANAVDWLVQDEALISIRSKNRTPPPLRFESDFGRNALKWGNLVGIPMLFGIFGAIRVTGRQRRAERRWKEVGA